MKNISISDTLFRVLSNDARKRQLTPEEVIEVLLKREYKMK